MHFELHDDRGTSSGRSGPDRPQFTVALRTKEADNFASEIECVNHCPLGLVRTSCRLHWTCGVFHSDSPIAFYRPLPISCLDRFARNRQTTRLSKFLEKPLASRAKRSVGHLDNSQRGDECPLPVLPAIDLKRYKPSDRKV